MRYKKGDMVKVWSLQSFYGGGFLNGETAIVRQNQHRGSNSVLLIVTRNVRLNPNESNLFSIDTSYEVYDKQIELIKNTTENKRKQIDEFIELNRKIRQFEQDKDGYNTLYQYAPEFYFDDDMNIQLNENLLKYPELFL